MKTTEKEINDIWKGFFVSPNNCNFVDFLTIISLVILYYNCVNKYG